MGDYLAPTMRYTACVLFETLLLRPEALPRHNVDIQLAEAGWAVQSVTDLDLSPAAE